VADSAWRKHAQLVPRIRAAVRNALQGVSKISEANVTILLTSDEAVRELNWQYRGKNKPTNVLSFPPANDDTYLGDIAIAYGVTKKEAVASKKAFASHAIHLAVHGILHLLGYDHVRLPDARKMEALEISILSDLGIPNPYRSQSQRRA
jgi:probable rRNA maturation factor